MAKKPFFFRIDAAALIDFATDPEGENITLLRFAKELQKGASDIEYIQSVISEAHQYIEKKRVSGREGGKAKASTAIAPLEDALANGSTALAKASTPLASSSSSNSSSNRETKDKVKRFVPPSVPEVETYMKEIGFEGDAENFVDSNTAKGWLVGKTKTPAKDWKAMVRTWRNNDKKSNPPKPEIKKQLQYGDPGYVTDQRKLAL